MTKKSQRLYNIYTSILYRVKNSNICILKEWSEDFDKFKTWCLNNNYDDSKSIFLKDTSIGYFPDNCKIADKVSDVRLPKGRVKFKCIEHNCDNKTARANCRCRKCDSINKRKHKDYDRSMYARDWALKKKYNISLKDFNNMFDNQDGKCAICSKTLKLPEKTRGQDLDVVAVDHCHSTGKVRKLLCNACNKGLGLFLDNPQLLESARNYLLEEYNEKISNN